MKNRPTPGINKQSSPAENIPDLKHDIGDVSNIEESQLIDWQVTINNSPDAVIVLDPELKVIAINDPALYLLNSTREQAINRSYSDIMFPGRAMPADGVDEMIRDAITSHSSEIYLPDRDIWIKTDSQAVIDRNHKILAIIQKICNTTEQHQSASNTKIYRDFGIAIGEAGNIIEILKICLSTAIKMSGLDSGTIYYRDDRTGEFRALVSQGLSKEFIDEVSVYPSDTPNARWMMSATPVYSTIENLHVPETPPLSKEALKAIALLPLKYNGKVIGNISVASHRLDRIPENVHAYLEAIMTHARGAILRMQAEQEVIASEERYRLIAENVHDVIFTMSADLKINYISPSIKHLTGYTWEEFQQKPLADHFPPSQFERALNSMHDWKENTALKNEELKLETEMICKDSSHIWIDISIQPILQNGKFNSLVGVCRDITSRRQFGIQLREREERYRALFESSPISIWEGDYSGVKTFIESLRGKGIQDIKTHLEKHPTVVKQCYKLIRPIEINNATLEMMKCKDKNTFLKNIDLLIVDRTLPSFRECLVKLAAGERICQTTIMHRTFENNMILCELRLTIVPGYENDWGRVISTLVDITEHNVMEQAIKDSEKKFRDLFENASDCIIYLSTSGEIMEVNHAAAELFGGSIEEIKGRHFTGLGVITAADIPGFLEIFRRILNGERGPFSVNITNRKGKQVTLESSAKIMKKDRKISGILIMTRDVTERTKLEEERQQNDRLESVGTLAGGIAHDFNNLLTGIMGNIGLAKTSEDPKSETYEMLEEAEKASVRAKNLTQQLLTFSKGGEPIKKPLSIGKMLRESTEFSLRGSNVKPRFSISPDLWTINADEGQMVQVITNLVINAQDSMPDGGIIEVDAQNVILKNKDGIPLKPGKYARIVVKDQGIGIKQEHLKRIFEPYFTTKQKGSGLGLATVYAIIKKHNGHIDVESALGVGSAFRIHLPAIDSPVSAKTEPKHFEPKPISGGRILVMDDNELIRELVPRILAISGFDTDTAQDGNEALKKYEKAYRAGKKFDIVIMDLTIPGGMGGKEAIKLLKKIDRNAKVIASSGYANDPILANYAQYGFSAVVVKPYSAEEMQQVINRLMRHKK